MLRFTETLLSDHFSVRTARSRRSEVQEELQTLLTVQPGWRRLSDQLQLSALMSWSSGRRHRQRDLGSSRQRRYCRGSGVTQGTSTAQGGAFNVGGYHGNSTSI